MATRRGLYHVVGYRSKKGLRWVRCLDRVRDAAESFGDRATAREFMVVSWSGRPQSERLVCSPCRSPRR